MDTLTHALLGASVAAVAPVPGGRSLSRGERLALGAVAGAFPDIDFIGFAIDPLAFLAHWHQGPTHALPMLPMWALLIGVASAMLRSRRELLAPASLLAALALASHTAADAITAYGTALWWPLSDVRFGLGAVYVIDPLFTGILLAGIGALVRGHAKAPVLALAALCAYVGALITAQQQALVIARDSNAARPRETDTIAALAQPFSPLNWKLVVQSGTRLREAHLNLAGHPPLPLPGPLARTAAAYQSASALRWHDRAHPEAGDTLIRQRWNDPRLAPFRHFARFPALSTIERGNVACVWFTDLRYDLPALPDTFRYGFCRERPTDAWRLYRLRYFSANARQLLEH